MNGFSNFICQYRENNEVSREEVVDIIKSKFHRISGIDSKSISMWERNTSCPSIKKMCQVISALEKNVSVIEILKTFTLPKNARLRNTLDRVVTRKVGSIPFKHKIGPAHWFNDEGQGGYLEAFIGIDPCHSSKKKKAFKIMRLSVNNMDAGIIIYSAVQDGIYIHYINYIDINALRHCLMKLCDLLEFSNCDYLMAHNLDQTMMDFMMLLRGTITQRKIVMDKFFVISRVALILNELDPSPQRKALS
ncbi:helix-turn-helix domain-containing protein [Vibrio coralliilyticus]|uniref:Helix-turn-helix transcriptional regulator n=1 Tax=Vibrio coralliilyticus TaxID=190893 RepID=A0AAP6ZSM4_9VIBR|nr:helix-turn-helix transcriptional regulator [Vibrio coralliilyticus]NOJ24272.1 helix-turn-helix transcriptional regulator [Vibrio coralliilyticus]